MEITVIEKQEIETVLNIDFPQFKKHSLYGSFVAFLSPERTITVYLFTDGLVSIIERPFKDFYKSESIKYMETISEEEFYLNFNNALSKLTLLQCI